ncbi:MAG: PIG-L family deacetylase [Burkholderiaceae bacterium]
MALVSPNPFPPRTPRAAGRDDAAELSDWQAWVGRFAELMQAPLKPAPELTTAQTGGLCMIFAPHPDDECIVGALPLRLRQEAGWRVCNVAVTLGSKPERRQPRWQELEDACALLGFENIRPGEQGLEDVRPDTARLRPALWASHLAQMSELLSQRKPELLLLPFAEDGNATHKGVHQLIGEAIARAGLTTVVAETEFWGTMPSPNWMVETSALDTARLIQALARHRGEVKRNPYHLRLPAFLADSVRRGGELIAGAGSAPPDYAFATLYRLSLWREGRPCGDLPPRLCPAEHGLQSAWLASEDPDR